MNFAPAAALLAKAADCIDQAARLTTAEAAQAERLTRAISARQGMAPAADCSMEDLTKIAVDLAAKGREIRGWGQWLDGIEA